MRRHAADTQGRWQPSSEPRYIFPVLCASPTVNLLSELSSRKIIMVRLMGLCTNSRQLFSSIKTKHVFAGGVAAPAAAWHIAVTGSCPVPITLCRRPLVHVTVMCARQRGAPCTTHPAGGGQGTGAVFPARRPGLADSDSTPCPCLLPLSLSLPHGATTTLMAHRGNNISAVSVHAWE